MNNVQGKMKILIFRFKRLYVTEFKVLGQKGVSKVNGPPIQHPTQWVILFDRFREGVSEKL